jgi:membrane-associated protease RseP (regulator of RpoE activity)
VERPAPQPPPDPRWPGIRDPAAISFRSGPAPPPPRYGLHLALLVATFVTLTLAGGYFWESHRWAGADGTPGIGQVAIAGIPYAIWVLTILGAHEMGHYLACRRYGIPATLPFFLPFMPPFGTFGAVIRIRGRVPDRRALFDIAAAGPIAGFLVAVPVLATGIVLAESPATGPGSAAGMQWFFGESLLVEGVRAALGRDGIALQANSMFGAGWLGLLVTSLNLFPVGQLDGGHAMYAVSRRWHRIAAYSTIVGLLGVIAYQAIREGQVPTYVLWFAILLWMRDRHPRLADEETGLGAGRLTVAAVLLVLFALTFMPTPITIE